MSLQRDYFENQAIKSEYKVKKQRDTNIIAIILVVIVLTISIIIIYALKMRTEAQGEKIKRILSLHNYEKTIIEVSQKRILELEQLLEAENNKSQNLIKELIAQQEKLEIYSQQAYLKEITQNSIANSEIVIRFQKLLSNNQNPQIEDWDTLDRFVNTNFPLFKNTLYSLAKLSEQEYYVCLLIKCKFTQQEISKLINRSRFSMSSIRRRLYYKLFKKVGTTQDCDEFILGL